MIEQTPDARFAAIPDYPFAPHWIEVDRGAAGPARQHYVDEGPRDAPPFLLLHGEPSWSYLYRHMIGPLAKAEFRVIAPDLIGFGKSDKPTDPALFTYAAHAGWLRQFIEALDLRNIGLFVQDWGGLLGLRQVAAMPERFDFVIASNTGLPIGKGAVSPAFTAWREFARTTPDLPVGKILQGGTSRTLSDAEVAAYDAPFVSPAQKAAAQVFPSLVPIEEDDPGAVDNVAAWERLVQFDKPFRTLFTDEDPVTKGGEKPFIARVPGAQRDDHRIVEGAGHFCQEDRPEVFVEALLALRTEGGG